MPSSTGTSSSGSAIDLEPYTESWGVTDVWIIHNTFTSVRLATVAAKGGGDVSRIVFAFNKGISEPLQLRNTPTTAERRHDWYIVGNTSDTTFGSPNGMYWITNTDGVSIWDNVQPLQPGRHQVAITTTGSTGVSTGRNSFPEG